MTKIFFSTLFLLFQIYSTKLNLRNSKENKFLGKNEEKDKSDDIIIIHTNDVHCGIMNSIGYDGLMLYKKELQEKYKYVLTIDVGDHVQGDIIGLLSKGLDIIEIMNKIGYDISTLGNHEFDYGLDPLYECSKKLSNGGYISANFCYRESKAPIFPPYKILNVGDKKIAFIGLTTPITLTGSSLYNIVDENGNRVYDFLSENNGQLLYDTVQNYINKLKENKTDYIIILDHIGDEADTVNQYTSSLLLSNIYGVDAMLDAHTHKIYNKTGLDKKGNSVILAQTGTKLSNIGVLKIKTNGEISSEIISEVPKPDNEEYAEKVIRNKKEVWVDKEMNSFLINITNKYSGELDKKIGHSDFDLIVNTDPNKDHHKHACRSEETTLGNLITDAFRYVGKTDIALANGASIRGDLLKGDISFKMILNILPYSSEIVTKQILGEDILDALELGVKNLPEKSAIFQQVSGISFKVNIGIKSTIELDENGIFIRVKGERRVYDVKVGNEKLDLKKLYSISMPEYTSDGGDGFSMFSKYKDSITTSKLDNEALKIYLDEELKGEIPEKYRNREGRIRIINEDEDSDDDNDWIISLIIICLFLASAVLVMFIFYFMKLDKKREDDELLEKIGIEPD